MTSRFQKSSIYLFCFSIGVLLTFLSVRTHLLHEQERAIPSWQSLQAYQLGLIAPANWQHKEYTANPGYDNRKKIVVSGWIRRHHAKNYGVDMREVSDYCQNSFQHIEMSLEESLSTKATSTAEFKSLRGFESVLKEKQLLDGIQVILGKGRFASAPCISAQYSIHILEPGKRVWTIHFLMDENRPDIVTKIFDSLHIIK